MTAGAVGWCLGLPALQRDPSPPAIATCMVLWPPGTHLGILSHDTGGQAALLGLAPDSAFPNTALPASGSCLRGGPGHGN